MATWLKVEGMGPLASGPAEQEAAQGGWDNVYYILDSGRETLACSIIYCLNNPLFIPFDKGLLMLEPWGHIGK
jgi:hypothetical protein